MSIEPSDVNECIELLRSDNTALKDQLNQLRETCENQRKWIDEQKRAMVGVCFKVIEAGYRGAGPGLSDLVDWLISTKSTGDRIRDAAIALYQAGFWTCNDLPLDAQMELWMDLRDACGIAPGNSPAPVAAPAAWEMFMWEQRAKHADSSPHAER